MEIRRTVVIIVAICAFTLLGVRIWNDFGHRGGGVAHRDTPVGDWKRYAQRGQRMGPVAAQVTIVEFSDFQCPYCRTLAGNLGRLMDEFPEHVAVIFRHFPLTEIHPQAIEAALAAECAGAQNAFRPFHDLLFENQARLDRVVWSEIGQQGGVHDAVEFEKCLEQREYLDRVHEDLAAGERLGVEATPTLLFQGEKLVGSVSLEELRRRVWTALNELQ